VAKTGSLNGRLLCAAALAAGCTVLPRSTAATASGTAAGVAPVASSRDDYRRIEREVGRELNEVRSKPRQYASNVSALLPYFEGNLLRRPA
jgi:uncharacterized membrane protein